MVVRRIPSAAAKNALPVLLGVVFKNESGPCPRSPLPPPIQRGPGGLHEDNGVAPTLLESGGQRDVHVDGDGARGAAGPGGGGSEEPPGEGNGWEANERMGTIQAHRRMFKKKTPDLHSACVWRVHMEWSAK